MAKDLAREVGYIYIDSGAMYRAVTLYSIENGIFDGNDIDTEKLRKEIRNIRISFRLNPATGRPDTYLNGVNVENRIRTMEVSSKVSPISALDFVRTEMVAQQQAMGKEKGIVMDGRDIGTTVFPEAELKIFVTATPEIRAQRRYDELKAKGQEASFDGQTLELTGTEFTLLYLLAQHLGQVVSREHLSQEVLGKRLTPFDRAIDMHISNLRRKLPDRKDGHPWFKTLRGRGYLMVSAS